MYLTKTIYNHDPEKTKLNFVMKFASYFLTKKVKKKEFLLKAGEVSEHLIFVKKGLLRVFLTSEGKEVNTWFTKEEQFITSINSFHYEFPSYENIQAIEESEVIMVKKSTYNFVLRNNRKLAQFTLNIIYQHLSEFQNQCLALRFMTAEEKYAFMMKTEPELMSRLSQKHIASYLGIETTYMSRIIANYK